MWSGPGDAAAAEVLSSDMAELRVVIVNGKVAEEAAVATAVDRLRADGVPTDVRITGGAGEARKFAAAAAEAGAAAVIVCGGDGTINEVVSGLVPARADTDDADAGTEPAFGGALGVVPTGTANDFAACAGIPVGDPVAAAMALEQYEPALLDVGRVEGGADALFLNVATAGFGAEVSAEASEELKDVLGRVSYLVAGLASAGELRPREATITAPDFERRIAFYLLAIGNARCAGGGMPVCPDANPADGLFDVTIVPEGTVGATLGEIVRSGLEGVGEAGLRFRAPWVEVRSNEPLQVNLDGEPASGTRFRFDVLRRALRVLLPGESPLLSDGGV